MKKVGLPILIAMLVVFCVSIIGFVGCESSSGSSKKATVGNFSITPASITFTVTTPTNIAFTVTGGTPAYTWYVSDASLGAVTPAGDTAVYTSTTNTGVNHVTVTDATNISVTATIKAQ